MPRLMVTGCRDVADPTFVKRGIVSRLSTYPRDWIVMQGGARGVDRWTQIACEITGHACETFLPDRSLPSPARYHARNDQMLALADDVLAFWDGNSRGTASVIRKAEARGIKLWVVRIDRTNQSTTAEDRNAA